jgi:hypothetical protein
MTSSYSSHLWCAANIMKEFCSDDSFDYFRYWLIASGKQVYYGALAHPDNLATYVIPSGNLYRFEEFGSLADDILEKYFGVSIYDYDNLRPTITKPKIKLTWSGDRPGTMKKLCPRLFDLFY